MKSVLVSLNFLESCGKVAWNSSWLTPDRPIASADNLSLAKTLRPNCCRTQSGFKHTNAPGTFLVTTFPLTTCLDVGCVNLEKQYMQVWEVMYSLVQHTCVLPPCKFCFQVPPYRRYPLIVEPTPRPESPIIMIGFGFGFLLDDPSPAGPDDSSMNKDAC